MGKLVILVFLLLGNSAWAKSSCESALLPKPKLLYTQDVMPIGPKTWDESTGYAYKSDEYVVVVQLDFGVGYPRPFVGIFPDDGSTPDLKKYRDFIKKHGLDKGLSILLKDPTYLLSQR